MPILLKLYRCFCHDLKICMWFGYYPEIIFCHFFCNLNLVIFKCTIMAGDINSLNLLVYLCIRGHAARGAKWVSFFSKRQGIERLQAGDSPESLFYVLLYSLLSTVQIYEDRSSSPHG